jgi:hypothetical protein
MKNEPGAVALAIALAMVVPAIAGFRCVQATRLEHQQGDKSDEKPADRQAAGLRGAHIPADKIKLETKLVSVTVTVSDPVG